MTNFHKKSQEKKKKRNIQSKGRHFIAKGGKLICPPMTLLEVSIDVAITMIAPKG